MYILKSSAPQTQISLKGETRRRSAHQTFFLLPRDNNREMGSTKNTGSCNNGLIMYELALQIFSASRISWAGTRYHGGRVEDSISRGHRSNSIKHEMLILVAIRMAIRISRERR